MGLIVVLVFLGVFSVVALVAVASGSGACAAGQAGARHARLRPGDREPGRARPIVDLRKSEQLSSIPWLNREAAEV